MADVPTRYVALGRKITIGMLALSVIPLFTLGLFIHQEFSRTSTDRLESTLRMVTANKRDAIEMFLNERVCQLRSLARTIPFSELGNPGKTRAGARHHQRLLGVIHRHRRQSTARETMPHMSAPTRSRTSITITNNGSSRPCSKANTSATCSWGTVTILTSSSP